MDKRFLRAFLTPKATRLCGYDLYPWCLKHRLWLTALEHPLLESRDPTPAEIVFFARVCAEQPVGPPTWRDRYEAAKLQHKPNLYAALDVARSHFRMDCWPRFWERSAEAGEGGRNNGVPWALSIITNLTRNGHTLEEALNLPECQAIWLSASISISHGAKLDIYTTEDEELLDDLSRVGSPPPTT